MKPFNVCVFASFLGSATVQADVLPLEQTCGLLGQMGLTIASSPKTQHTVLQDSVTLAEHHSGNSDTAYSVYLTQRRPAQTLPVSVLDSFFSTARGLASNMSCPWCERGSLLADTKLDRKLRPLPLRHHILFLR